VAADSAPAGRYQDVAKEEADMKKILVPLAVALLASSPALAAWTHVTETIKSINASTHKLTLSNGRTYTLESGVDASGFTKGDKVTLNAEISKGKRVANQMTKSS
jgi:hypothetical protein